MKYLLTVLLLGNVCLKAQDLLTTFEKSNGTETATYAEGISFYKSLADEHETINIEEVGQTDAGPPLHLVTFNIEKEFDYQEIKSNNRTILLINNAIHPGEPDGVEASMMLLRDVANNPDNYSFLKEVVISIIPFYNIGGVLNRNTGSRVNQNGPIEYGFRGNAKNYDLNRDFMKMDSKNAFAFTKIFHKVQPDFFVDTHVTNGSDHQEVLTLLTTQHNKLMDPLGEFLDEVFEPEIINAMESRDQKIVEYLNVHGSSPNNGWNQFDDSPRYSTGYAALFGTIGFMTETHMWKPFPERVSATYDLLLTVAELASKHGSKVKKLRQQAITDLQNSDSIAINFKHSKDVFDSVEFNGYKASLSENEFTGNQLLKYDRNKTFTKKVPFYNYFEATAYAKVPAYYVIPAAYENVIDRLSANNVQFSRLAQDSSMLVQSYRLRKWQTAQSPFEGHYLHYNTEVKSEPKEVQFRKDDYLIPVNQDQIRFIMEALEPEAKDSYFNWNFFDTILQQKEGFSDYVFVEKAKEILESLPVQQKQEFYERKEADANFANSNYQQLDWIYKRSKHYEEAHLQYPIYKKF